MDPVVVDIRSVDKELTNLWRKASEGALQGVSGPLTRVVLSNLLVYALSEVEADEAQRLIADMSADHPTRAVIVDSQSGDGIDPLQAAIAVSCSIGDRGITLCGEQIRLHLHDVAAGALGTIIPLLAPDLPIYLWTPGDIDPDDQALRQLARMSDHWIIDSRAFRDREAGLQLASILALEEEPRLMLHDLAWASTIQWRESIAQVFDPPQAREYLHGVKSVQISGAGDSAPNVESLLLAAWLIHQLDWRNPQVKRQQNEWAISTDSDAGRVDVRLIAGAERDAVTSIEIDSEIESKQASFRWRMGEDPNELTIESETLDAGNTRQTILIDSPSRRRDLCRALDASGADRMYERLLPTLMILT